ncbi:MAG TPA: hypothetical protein VFO77_09910, partial [Actinoplanes sp.]|nr:hypothetical protein [Actinoplanes sp.]
MYSVPSTAGAGQAPGGLTLPPAARTPAPAGLTVPPAVEAARVIAAVLADLTSGDHRGVVVDSPPGAGKSTLVVRAAGVLAGSDAPLMIIAQTNEQVDD